MTIEVEIQRASSIPVVPSDPQFRQWAAAALRELDEAELLIRIVDLDESRELNFQFRNRNQATNVLSFPSELPEEIDLPLLGDVIICAPLVEEEARQQNKVPLAHWAHLTIHGILHLLGYDHQTEDEAADMEALEISLLRSLDFQDPYQGNDD
jgi:probable rRNA maturation factor